MDPRTLRTCLGQFATGVTIVTTRSESGSVRGATVNAFTAVSLDPALVLVSLDRRAALCADLPGRPFAVNVLSAGQTDLAMHFAGRPVGEVVWEEVTGGAQPKLAGTVAYMSCDPWKTYDGGDHVLYVGEVRELCIRHGEPLLFHGGEFQRVRNDSTHLAWDTSADAPTALSSFRWNFDPPGPIHPTAVEIAAGKH